MPHDKKKKVAAVENHGIIPGIKKTDWAAGTIPYEVRLASGDWRSHQVRGEKQWFRSFDTMACVSFATNNTCEIQYKQQTGIELNFSDRMLAKQSQTTPQGNWVYLVLDTARIDGQINEEEWPAPPEPTSWSAYYSAIPMFVMNRAQTQSKDKFSLAYEVINDKSATSIAYHLKHAPLLITIPGHEVVGVALQGNNLIYFDSYDPWIKSTSISNIDYIYKAVITAKGKPMSQIKTQAKGASRRIVLEASSIEEWIALCKVYGKDPNVAEETV